MVAKFGAIFITSLFSLSMVSAQQFPGSAGVGKSRIKIIGEVIAAESPKLYVEGHAPDFYYFVQVTNVISGRESNRIILVRNRPSARKHSFIRAVSNRNLRFVMDLRRSDSCDATMADLQQLSRKRDPHEFKLPIVWFNRGVAVSEDEMLPCYYLGDRGFRKR